MNKKENLNPESSYSTGDIRPEKKSVNLLAVILVAVILLGSTVSLMGILNIPFGPVLDEAAPAVVFSEQMSATDPQRIGAPTPMLGIRCETVSPFLHHYYDLPTGVYVTQLLDQGAALSAGLQPGDVIVALDGKAMTTAEALAEAIRSRQVGDEVWLTISRDGKEHRISLVLKGEESK